MKTAVKADVMRVLLKDEAATVGLAEDIASVIKPGDLVALSGGLGSGKTTFARGLVRTLAGDPDLEVPSPTFPLRIDYALPRLPIVHVDLYRMRSAEELLEIGFEEALAECAVVVEWPERLPSDLGSERLDIRFEIENEERHAELLGYGTWPERLTRARSVRAFLDESGWSNASRTPIAGDASYRAYERVLAPLSPPSQEGEGEGKAQSAKLPSPLAHPPQQRGRAASAILMNAPARAKGPPVQRGRSYDAVAHRSRDVRALVAIGTALRSAGIHAPEILATDIESGLLLLEDLGSEGILDASGRPFPERYEAAIDLLVFMHGRNWPARTPLPDGSLYTLPPYDRDALLIEVSLFPDWFAGAGGEPAFPAAERADFLAAWAQLIKRIEASPTTWVMRDFHSPNILWQEEASGIQRVGVIDFQDALIGNPAYDVASLAQDARAPLSADEERRLKSRYVEGRKRQDALFDADRFDTAYAILGAQRATKVLGIFTRLALNEGKAGYQRHRTRLKELLRRNLAHPVLSDLRLWYEPFI